MTTPSEATSIILDPTSLESESAANTDKRVKPIDAVTPEYRKIKRKKEEDPEYLRENKRKNNARQARFREKKKLKANESVDSPLGITLYLLGLMLVLKLKEMRDLWGKVHCLHPNKATGLMIIDYFLDNPDLENNYVVPRTYEFKTEPTVGDLFEDLQNHEDFQSTSSELDKDGTFADFVKGWVNMAEGKDPGDHRPYCAFNVKCKSGKGLSRHMKDEIPNDFLKDGVVTCRTGEHGTIEWTIDVTPAFNVSRLRMNETGVGRALLGVYGVTILFWWTYSKELLRLFEEFKANLEDEIIMTALKTWPGLRWSVLSPGEYIQIDTGMVYCTMSPVNSATSGWPFFNAMWLINGQLEAVVSKEMAYVEKSLELQDGPDPEEISGKLRKGVQYWESCLNSPMMSKKDKIALRKVISEVKERLAILNRERLG